jgi:hypothetical protein
MGRQRHPEQEHRTDSLTWFLAMKWAKVLKLK